jgi:TPR repeat protein
MDGVGLSQACYARVGPPLRSADGKLTKEVRNAYLDWAEETVLRELRQDNQPVPDSCLAEVRQNDTLRDAIYGSVFPPDPSILQNYAQLRAQLGAKFLAKYRSLVIAIAVARRTQGVEQAGGNQDVGRDYQPGFWTDESLHTPGSEAERDFIRRIAAFIQQAQIPAAALYENSTLQAQLRDALTRQSVPANLIDEIKRSAPFGERLKNVMVLLGQRPAARDPKPATVDWLRHLTAITEAIPTSTPTVDGRVMPWPLFPLDTAPWPLLMPLAHPVPLSEADYIWEAFQGKHGPDRYHTYGPYRGDDDVIPDSLRPSQWFWDAWPDRIVHGGMCVPISKGTVDLYSALGKPAMWAGQPGHANLISFQYVDGAWTSEVEQAFAGGPDVTFAQWYFDEPPGTELRFRDLYYWAGAEYHLGLALAMNVGLKSYLDTRLAANIFRTLPPEERPTLGARLLRSVLPANPYNPEVWYRLAEQTPDAMQALALAEAAMKREPGLLAEHPGNATPEKGDGASGQYWNTLAPFVARYALLEHPAPQSEENRNRVYSFLKTVPGMSGDEQAAYAEQFAASSAPGMNSLVYDQHLADEGDAYGLLRMGQRYRDGDGVPQNDEKAQQFLAHAATQGDAGAGSILADLNPTLPGDQIRVTASSVFSQDQVAKHLVDGAGLSGLLHDNQEAAQTMWHTVERPDTGSPARGLAPSPAWVRFDFARPVRFETILIWNHNQARLTDRGFRRTHIYGSTDGQAWIPLTRSGLIELPRAGGAPYALPTAIPNGAARQPLKAVIIAADATGGNYGGECYGLSAVRFVTPRLENVIPARAVSVTASSVYSSMQAAQHLVDGSGMTGALHDNAEAAQTMWHTPERPAAQVPAQGLPASPAWVRFDFAQPQQIETVLIWNHNQEKLTGRGFRKVRLYGSLDGMTWRPLTSSPVIELPRASGAPMIEPTAVTTDPAGQGIRSVIIAAEEVDGNYGGDCYGLSAVRFVARH